MPVNGYMDSSETQEYMRQMKAIARLPITFQPFDQRHSCSVKLTYHERGNSLSFKG